MIIPGEEDDVLHLALIGGVAGEGKSGPAAAVMEAMRLRAEVVSVEQAIELVRAALEVVQPYSEVVEVHDRSACGLRIISLGDATRPPVVTRAMANKLRMIRIEVCSELRSRHVLLRIPDLLLVADGTAVTSIWDGIVRQVVED